MVILKDNIEYFKNCCASCTMAIVTRKTDNKCYLAAILKSGDEIMLSEPDYVWNYPLLPINELESQLKKPLSDESFITLGDGKCMLNNRYILDDIVFTQDKDKRFSTATAVFDKDRSFELYEVATTVADRERDKILAKLRNVDVPEDDLSQYFDEDEPNL